MRAGRALVLGVPWAWLAVFLVAPCAIVLAIALAEPVDAVPPFSLAHPEFDSLILVATDPLYRAAFLLSLKVASLSTLVCLLAGYPMALAIARCDERWRSSAALAVDAAVRSMATRPIPARCGGGGSMGSYDAA